MKLSLISSLVFALVWFSDCSAQSITVSGYVIDSLSNETLISANIYSVRNSTGTVSNENGFFSHSFQNVEDTVVLEITYVGYKKKVIVIEAKESVDLGSIRIHPETLKNVVISEMRSRRPENKLNIGQIEINLKDLEQSPKFLGETDIVKLLQLMPGVQSGNEGLAGLYVRGGSPDQNLVLIDGVPIYNTSHALGLFSIFDNAAIKDAKLIKGGFPAQYGGRLSSILDIKLKDGNQNHFSGKGSIGLLSSSISLNGPIKKNQTTFSISGRRSYPDIIARPFLNFQGFQSYFYDLNLKLKHRFTDKTSITFSTYSGLDKFLVKEAQTSGNTNSNGVEWANKIASLKLNTQNSPKIYSTITASVSDYNLGVTNNFESENLLLDNKFDSGIRDYRIAYNCDISSLPNLFSKIGVSNTLHTYRPGELRTILESNSISKDTSILIDKSNGNEFDSYLENIWEISSKNNVNMGVHFTAFSIRKKTFYSTQPRLLVSYKIKENMAIKTSYSYMSQFINLLTSEAFNLPTDQWVPSTDRILPQKAHQITLGLGGSFGENFEYSSDFFYKSLENVVSLKEGSIFLADFTEDWENIIVQGKGKIYGFELFVKKKYGRMHGWLGYTWSQNQRQFDEINFGRWFPFKFDRRHDASFVFFYQLKPKITISGSWVYATGNAITLVTQKYASSPFYSEGSLDILNLNLGENLVVNEKNNYRLTNYHRLDLSVNFTKELKKKRKRILVLSVYNLYNHINPYFVRVNERIELQSDQTFKKKLIVEEVGILPFLPSINYSITF